jgi:hypothetical protein
MKFALAKEHREFFAKNHYIEFENLLTLEESTLLHRKITELLPKKQHDLWRQDKDLEKIVLSRKLAEVAADLFKQPELRIAFDQYQKETSPRSLQQRSSLQPLIAALALPLDEPLSSAIYFSPTTPEQLPFFSRPLLLIAYCSNKTQYTLVKEDPHTHALKALGYAFGDSINSSTHPLLLKR